MPRSSSDSDSELEIPSSIRVNLRRDVGMAGRATSPIVTAAAKRQLRGGKGERKTAKEVAAEIRNKEQANIGESSEDLPSRPASEQPKHDFGTTIDMITSALGSALEAAHEHPQLEVLQTTQEALNESKTSATSLGPGQKVVSIRRKGISTPGKESTSASVGIGVKFTQTLEGEHIVTSLLPGGPADLTKQVEVNDKIVAVNGDDLKGKTSEQIISLIVGPPGTVVELLLEPSRTTISGPAKQETSPLLATPIKAVPPPGEQDVSRSASPPPITAASPAPPISAAPPADDSSPTAPAFASSKRSYGRSEPEAFSTPEQPPAPRMGTPPPAEPVRGGRPGGVGVKFQSHADRSVTVASVMHNSPAEDSHRIHPADRILLVDGAEVEGKTPAEVDQMTAGVPGSNVVLTLQSAFDKQVRSVTLHRKPGLAGEGVTVSSSPPQRTPVPSSLPVNRAWQPQAATPPIHPKETIEDKQGAEGAARRGQEENSQEQGKQAGAGKEEKGKEAKKEVKAKVEEIKPAAPAPPEVTLKRVELGEQRLDLEMKNVRAKVDQQLHTVEHSNARMVDELQALHVKVQGQEKVINKQEARIKALEERPQGCACVIS